MCVLHRLQFSVIDPQSDGSIVEKRCLLPLLTGRVASSGLGGWQSLRYSTLPASTRHGFPPAIEHFDRGEWWERGRAWGGGVGGELPTNGRALTLQAALRRFRTSLDGAVYCASVS